MKALDANVEAVITKHRHRAEKGLAKYGVTTERADATTHDWLNHLQEELMDAAVYVERLKHEGAYVPAPSPSGEDSAAKYGEPWHQEGGMRGPYIVARVPRCRPNGEGLFEMHAQGAGLDKLGSMHLSKIADRVIACVNAIQGIDDPIAFRRHADERIAELKHDDDCGAGPAGCLNMRKMCRSCQVQSLQTRIASLEQRLAEAEKERDEARAGKEQA